MKKFILFALITLVGLLALPLQRASGKSAVVRAILFYSPSCPHCHQVMSKDLPPLQNKYGGRLEIVEINVDTQEGLELYRAAVDRFSVPKDRIGVPALFVGETHLVGSREIPETFPGLIEAGLASGGVEFPDIPGLADYLPTYQPNRPLSLVDRFTLDPLANSLAVLVLIGMLFSAFWIASRSIRFGEARTGVWPVWALPALAVAGLGIAAYLSYVELTRVEAVCGPVGDCNTVQMSSYARLFGFLPVGVLGMLGYLVILLVWLVARFSRNGTRYYAELAVCGFAWAGLLFMIYLTFLEPFIIGATCAWCLTSAVVMTSILWASTRPAINAWVKLVTRKSPLIHPI